MKGVHISSTNSTHLHILIKVYDLFLLKDPVFDLATQEGQVCLQFFPTLSFTQAFLEVGEKEGNNLPW